MRLRVLEELEGDASALHEHFRGRGMTEAAAAREVETWLGAAPEIWRELGTLVGISQVATAMSSVQNAPSNIVWSGINLALSTTVVGTLLFLLGLAGWGMLRARMR